MEKEEVPDVPGVGVDAIGKYNCSGLPIGLRGRPVEPFTPMGTGC